MAEQGTCDTIPAPQNLAFRVEPRKLDSIKMMLGSGDDHDDEYYHPQNTSDLRPEGSSSSAGGNDMIPLHTTSAAAGTYQGGTSANAGPSNYYGDSASSSSFDFGTGSSSEASPSSASTSTASNFTSSHPATRFISAVATDKKIATPSPVPTNGRRLCMRHQRSADEGVSLQLQKVRVSPSSVFSYFIFWIVHLLIWRDEVTRRVGRGRVSRAYTNFGCWRD